MGGQPPVESLAGLTEPGSFTTQDLRRSISEARKLRRRRKSPPVVPNDPSADDHPTVPYNPMVAYEAVPGHQVTHQPVVSSQPVQPGAPKSSPTAAPREPGTPNRRESAAGGSQIGSKISSISALTSWLPKATPGSRKASRCLIGRSLILNSSARVMATVLGHHNQEPIACRA